MLESSVNSDKNTIKRELSINIEQAIREILKSSKDINKSVNKSNIFTKRQEEEFRNIYKKLNIDLRIKIKFPIEKKKDDNYYTLVKTQTEYYTCPFLEVFILFMSSGEYYTSFNGLYGMYGNFKDFITTLFYDDSSYSLLKDKSYQLIVGDIKPFSILLRTFSLVKPSGDEVFTGKLYKFKSWLDYHKILTGKMHFKLENTSIENELNL